MTDAHPPEPPVPPPPIVSGSPSSSPFTDERQMAMIIYILYLVAPFTFHVAGIVALVLAYVARDGAPQWLRSHYTFQIHTFWIGLLYMVISGALFASIIGIPLGILALGATFVWFIVRSALGMARLMRTEAYANPSTWLV